MRRTKQKSLDTPIGGLPQNRIARAKPALERRRFVACAEIR